jgi:hypothetical protein
MIIARLRNVTAPVLELALIRVIARHAVRVRIVAGADAIGAVGFRLIRRR